MDSANVGEIGGTFGGSPLGCVAALEVIRTIEEEGLIERAQRIGEVFQGRFIPLGDRFWQIGDVRSLGAMCALEFVKDLGEPNKELAQEIIQKAHQRGLIIMGAGLHGNIIRLLTR